jgi:predicted permease
MSALRRFLRRLTSTTRPHDDARLQEELDAHLRMQAAANQRAGLGPDEARRQAVLMFGPVEAIKDRYRDEQRLPLLDDLIQDVRYTFRQLRKAPLFTLVATASLALAIGANAGVFTIVERVLLRPLPVSNPRELVSVTDERVLTQPNPRFSYPFYVLLRETRVLNGVAAHFGQALTVAVNGETVRASGELVSGNYFTVLGVEMMLGRAIAPADDATPGAHPVAVISEAFWRRTLASDPAIAGRTLAINGHAFAVLGVAPRRFTGTEIGRAPDIWIPLAMQREVGRDMFTESRTNWLALIGRLRAGADPEQSAQQLSREVQQRASALPPQTDVRLFVLQSAGRGSAPLRRDLGSALAALFALTALAVALACVNVAGLAAVRSASRERELAIRLALGARRSRLNRQLLTEGLVLAGLGGIAGMLIAPWAARALVAARSLPLDIEPGVEPRVLMFALGVSLVAGLLVALVPILASRNVRLSQTSSSAWTGARAAGRRLVAHDAVVALQIAMALAMLINAALLVQSVRGFSSVDPGFRADNLLLASLDARAGGYDSDRIDGFWQAILEQVRHVAGVQSASLAGTVPLAPGRQRQHWVNPTSGEERQLDTNYVGPRYFQTLGIPLVGGRDFTDDDRREARPVVIVNERVARSFWPGQDPVGKGIRLPDSGKPVAEVVGVARDAKYGDLRGDAAPMFYRPVLQTRSTDAMTLHVRTSGDRDGIVAAIRAAVHHVSRDVPLYRVTTLEEQLDGSFAQTRQAAALTGTFGALALLLSGIGVYGVTALAVSRRTRDIGIRMALGAGRGTIVRTISARVVTVVAVGLGFGLGFAFAFTRLTGALMFGVTAGDAATFVSMAALLSVVSALALSIPVRAATRLDALAAIRQE